MVYVIGLGTVASEIISGFERYPQYSILRISTDVKDTSNSKKLEFQKSAEKYEENAPSIKKYVKNIVDDEVLFICTGAEAECGVSLRIMEQIKDKKITVLYLKKDYNLITNTEVLQDRAAFGILQQYARSGLLQKIILVDLSIIDGILGDIPISEYREQQTQLIVNTYHMLQVYKNNKPVMSNMLPTDEVCRISTIGVSEIGDEDRLFYNLLNANEIYYYFAVNHEALNKDKKLLSKIKEHIKNKNRENVKTMYGIYPTDYEQDYLFCEINTKIIQEK